MAAVTPEMIPNGQVFCLLQNGPCFWQNTFSHLSPLAGELPLILEDSPGAFYLVGVLSLSPFLTPG